MLAWLQEFSLIVMIGCVGFYTATVFLALEIVKKRTSDRDVAEAALADAKAEIARLTSHGSDLIQRVGWRPQRLMNKPEYRTFSALEKLVAQNAQGHRVFSQVSCGEFLEVTYRSDLKDVAREATHCLNRKRVDFLIIDRWGIPCAVIEYQGAGHYRSNAYDRDQAKRIACHKAGIAFIEVPESGLQPAQRAAVLQSMGCTHSVAAE